MDETHKETLVNFILPY